MTHQARQLNSLPSLKQKCQEKNLLVLPALRQLQTTHLQTNKRKFNLIAKDLSSFGDCQFPLHNASI